MAELFFVGKKRYNIPDNVRDKFLETYPDAQPGITLNVKNKTYKIPSSLQDSFMEKNPTATTPQVLSMQPKIRTTEEIVRQPPELVTAQPETVAEVAGIKPVLDPQSEATVRTRSLEPDIDTRDKYVRFRANLLKEGSLGYLDMDIDEPQTPGENAVDVFGAVAGTVASFLSTGAGVGRAVGAAGKRLPRVANWINSSLGKNKTLKNVTFRTAKDLLTFNVYGQAYNRPDIKTLEDRLDLALKDSAIALAFGTAGALSHIPKYGRGIGTVGMGVLGWEMGGDTFSDKVINSVVLMGLHGLATKKPKIKKVTKGNEDLLMELYPELSRSEAQRISKKMVDNILKAKQKLPKELQKDPLLLLPERAESIRLAVPVGKSYDPTIMPGGKPIGLPSATTSTGLERGRVVRIKGIGLYGGLKGQVKELMPNGKVKVYIETTIPTKTGGRKIKGDRVFTTDKISVEPVIAAPGSQYPRVSLSPGKQLEFELQQVGKKADPSRKQPIKRREAQKEYNQIKESVSNTETILQNPNLTEQQRVAYEYSLNQLKQLKLEMLDAGSIKLYSGFPIHELFKSTRTSLKDLTKKEIDLLYREATKQPLIDLNKVGKTPDVPSDLKNVKTNFGKLKFITDVFKQARNRVKLKESKLFVRQIEEADEIWHSLSGKYVERLRRLGFDKLTEKQGLELGLALQNGTAPQYKSLLNEIRSELSKSGVNIGYIENYFPRVWKKEVASQIYNDLAKLQESMIKLGNSSDAVIAGNLKNYSKDTVDTINYLIKEGRFKSYSQAVDALKKDAQRSLFPVASFEKARTLDLPATVFETDARKVLPYYIDVMTKRIGIVKKFGADGSKAQRLIEKVSKKDIEEATILHEIKDLYTGDAERVRGYTGHARDLVNAFYGFEVGTKIGFGTATIPNITQMLVSIMPKLGVFRTIRGGLRLLDPQARAEIRGTGVLRESAISALTGVQPTGIMGKFSNYATKLGFQQINKANLYLAASTFKVGATDLMKIANSNSIKASWARKTLKQFNINYKKPLSEDLLVRKMYRFAVDSQLQKNVLKDPLICNDPKWKPLCLFKRFGIRQATMMKDMMMEEFKNGNPMPFLRLMAGGALGGEFVIWAKNKIKSELTGDAYYRKEDLLTVERFVNNLASVGSFGVVSDAMSVEKLSQLEGTTKFTITPVIVDDVFSALETFGSVMKDYEKYGDGFLAVERNIDDLAGAFGSLPKLIAKSKATKQQATGRQKRLRGIERTTILDLFLERKGKEGGRRLQLWNKYNPNASLSYNDINPSEIIKRAEEKQMALIKARQ